MSLIRSKRSMFLALTVLSSLPLLSGCGGGEATDEAPAVTETEAPAIAVAPAPAREAPARKPQGKPNRDLKAFHAEIGARLDTAHDRLGRYNSYGKRDSNLLVLCDEGRAKIADARALLDASRTATADEATGLMNDLRVRTEYVEQLLKQVRTMVEAVRVPDEVRNRPPKVPKTADSSTTTSPDTR